MIVESTEDIVRLSGAIRQNFWEAVQTAIALTLQRHPSGVIIDCSQITEITEEGAETFQSAIDFVFEHEDARIIFVGVPESVQEVMRHVPQVRSQMVVLDTVEEARKTLDLLATDDKRTDRKAYNRQILTVLCPNAFDQHVLDVTIELLSDHRAKVVLLMPLLVPRELPLQAPMPEEEERALCFADKAKAVLTKKNFPYEIRLERSRDLPSLVSEVAEEINAAHVIVSVAANHKEDDDMTKLFHNMLERVNRSLLFVRGKIEEPANL